MADGDDKSIAGKPALWPHNSAARSGRTRNGVTTPNLDLVARATLLAADLDKVIGSIQRRLDRVHDRR